MDVNEQLANERAKQWAIRERESGWCWYAGDERIKTYLWNHLTGVRNSIEAMQLKAHQEGIDQDLVLLALQRELRIIDGEKFAPGKPVYLLENGCTFLNSYRSMEDAANDQRSFPTPVTEDEIEPFIDLIERLTANDEDKQWLLCWMAHMIQKPEERPSVHPLFRSEHGIGKNVLVEKVLHRLLAGHTSTNNLQQVTNLHSESVANNLLVFVDESKAKGLNVYLKLKSVLASTFATINPKYVREYQQEIFARFMFADNTEGRAFNIEPEDRRIYVMEYVVHEESKQHTQEKIRDFLSWWSFGWVDTYHYLKNYDISEWSPFDCPMTEAKRDYLDMCSDRTEGLISRYREKTQRYTITENSWNSFVNQESLSLEECEAYQWARLHLNKDVYFKQKLEDVGFRERYTSKRIDGRQRRKKAWILTNHGYASEYDLVVQEESSANAPNDLPPPPAEVIPEYTV